VGRGKQGEGGLPKKNQLVKGSVRGVKDGEWRGIHLVKSGKEQKTEGKGGGFPVTSNFIGGSVIISNGNHRTIRKEGKKGDVNPSHLKKKEHTGKTEIPKQSNRVGNTLNGGSQKIQLRLAWGKRDKSEFRFRGCA